MTTERDYMNLQQTATKDINKASGLYWLSQL